MNKNIILIREQTGCPYMVIKKALWAANDNVDEAIKLLREKYGFGDHPKVRIKDWEIKYDKRYEHLVQPRDEANLFTERERESIKEAITTLNPTPLTRYAIEDLCDAIYKLGQLNNTNIKPEPDKLSEETKKWLDRKTPEKRLELIKDMCVDWDGYRTAAGLGGLVNEIWAYAAYPCKNEAHVMSMDELKHITQETIWFESKKDNSLTQFNKEGLAAFFLTGTLFNWSGFNETWRCWNKKPTEEQMKEMAWDGN